MFLKLHQQRAVIIGVGLTASFGLLIYFSYSPIRECLPLPQFSLHPRAYATIMSVPIDLEILPTQPSLFSQKIELKAKIVALVDARDKKTYATISVPGQLRLVNGQTSWVGHLAKNQEKTLSFTLQATQSGEWVVKALVEIVGEDGRGFGRSTEVIIKSNSLCAIVLPPQEPYRKIPAQLPVREVMPYVPRQPDPSYDPGGKRPKP